MGKRENGRKGERERHLFTCQNSQNKNNNKAPAKTTTTTEKQQRIGQKRAKKLKEISPPGNGGFVILRSVFNKIS